MYILGVHQSHNATATLLHNGKIIASVSEERFTRKKNQFGLPFKSIQYCLDYAKIEPRQIDLAVIPGSSWPNYISSLENANKVDKNKKSNYLYFLRFTSNLFYSWLIYLGYKISALSFLCNWYHTLNHKVLCLLFYPKLKSLITKLVGIPKERIVVVDHHLSHTVAALYASPYPKNGTKALIFTCDGEGDGVSATISIFDGKKFTRKVTISEFNSLGALYVGTTEYMGMKGLEHEYKVMGLAPYAHKERVIEMYEKFGKYLTLDKKTLNFRHKYTAQVMDWVMKKDYSKVRFDILAGVIQKLTEDLLSTWIQAAIKKYKITSIACAGGVFMNVKANMLISKLPGIKEMYIMPSCGDESNAIGAAYWGYKELTGKNPEPLNNLYLGPGYFDLDIIKAFNTFKVNDKYKVAKPKNISARIANLLAKGQVVAIFNERMEWGARALGNRTILADASKWEVVEEINKMIKARDFWMPFAPVILDSWEDKYLINPKHIKAPYMIMAFDSTLLAQEHLKAAMHPYDKTLRPQVIEKSWNSFYYQVLKEFEKITGKGGCLNTSFNIHGEPIVCSPGDAISVFERSGLKHLAIGKHIISKKAS